MVIIGGSFEIEPERREEFLVGLHEAMRRSRAEPGCLEYVMSADPIDPGRVVLFERWADQASLDAHIAALRAAPETPTVGAAAPTSTVVTIYEVTGERPLS